MSSKHHEEEIEQNSLAQYLENTLQAAKPHAPIIGGVALAVVLGWIAIAVMSNDGGEVKSQPWHAVFTTLNDSVLATGDDVKRQEVADEFARITEAYSDTQAAQWSEYFLAEQNLSTASELAFSDPEQAQADIQRAITSLQKVYEETDVNTLKLKALWGMALANEMLATPEGVEQAKSKYQEIMTLQADTPSAELAEIHLERLENSDVSGKDGFLAWYREQDFAALAAPAPQSRPPLDGTLPGLEGLEAPENGLFNPGEPTADPSGDPLFTPGMDLNGPATVEPKPSSFTEQEEPGTTEPPTEEPTDSSTESNEEPTEAASEAPAEGDAE